MNKQTAIEITEKLLTKANIENLKKNIDFYEYILSGLYNNHF